MRPYIALVFFKSEFRNIESRLVTLDTSQFSIPVTVASAFMNMLSMLCTFCVFHLDRSSAAPL